MVNAIHKLILAQVLLYIAIVSRGVVFLALHKWDMCVLLQAPFGSQCNGFYRVAVAPERTGGESVQIISVSKVSGAWSRIDVFCHGRLEVSKFLWETVCSRRVRIVGSKTWLVTKGEGPVSSAITSLGGSGHTRKLNYLMQGSDGSTRGYRLGRLQYSVWFPLRDQVRLSNPTAPLGRYTHYGPAGPVKRLVPLVDICSDGVPLLYAVNQIEIWPWMSTMPQTSSMQLSDNGSSNTFAVPRGIVLFNPGENVAGSAISKRVVQRKDCYAFWPSIISERLLKFRLTPPTAVCCSQSHNGVLWWGTRNDEYGACNLALPYHIPSVMTCVASLSSWNSYDPVLCEVVSAVKTSAASNTGRKRVGSIRLIEVKVLLHCICAPRYKTSRNIPRLTSVKRFALSNARVARV